MNKITNMAKSGRVGEVTAWILLAVLSVVILKNLAFLFIPLSIAILLCYAMGIPLELLQRYRIPGFLRIIIVVFVVLIVLYLFGRLVHANIREFQAQLPHFEAQLWIYAEVILDRLDISPDQAREMAGGFLDNFRQADLKPLGGMVKSLGGSFFSFLGNVLWVLLFMVFILAERESISKRIVMALGEDGAEPVRQSAERINKAVQHYLGLKTLLSLLTGFLVTVVLWIFAAPFAFLWGVLAFLLNFIPNIGSLIATVPPVLITLFQSGSVSRALSVAVAIIIVQMAVGNFLEPKMMGKGLGLSPLVVLLSLVFWGWMWGIPGMLLSVPLTAALKIAFEQVDSTRGVAIMMGSGK